MTIVYNKNDVENAIKVHLESTGMNLQGKKVTTERVKDLIHVRIEEENAFEEKSEGVFDDE